MFNTLHEVQLFFSLHTHGYCCYKSLPILLDTNTVSITYLSISISRYCFLLSLSHIFTFSHSGLTYPHAISYFILHLHYPFYEQRDCCHRIFFILLDTNMVPITYYFTKNTKNMAKSLCDFSANLVESFFAIHSFNTLTSMRIRLILVLRFGLPRFGGLGFDILSHPNNQNRR